MSEFVGAEEHIEDKEHEETGEDRTQEKGGEDTGKAALEQTGCGSPLCIESNIDSKCGPNCASISQYGDLLYLKISSVGSRLLIVNCCNRSSSGDSRNLVGGLSCCTCCGNLLAKRQDRYTQSCGLLKTKCLFLGCVNLRVA